MKILKFGGTSLSNGKKFIKITKIIKKNIKNEKIAIILSAPAKITNYLVKITKKYKKKKNFEKNIKKISKIIKNIIQEISFLKKKFNNKKILTFIKKEFKHLKKIFKNIYIYKKIPNKFYPYIISKGEYYSINIMKALLNFKNHNITIIDPVKKILAKGNILESKANIKISKNNFKKKKKHKKKISLMPGFIARNKKKQMILLGRNGSDYSASILAVCLKASSCEIWTDVDGIYSSDPKFIKKAKLLPFLTFQEAIKLSYFGAKVLHQKTISPLVDFNIPCIIKNTSNTKSPGTIIKNKKNKNKKTEVKGITYLKNIINIKIINKNVKIIKKIKKKILKFIKKYYIWNIILENNVYKNNINLYIKKKNEKEFKKFIKEKKIHKNNKIRIKKKLAIISIIGSNLDTKKKIAMKIFKTLYKVNINIFQIIQGNAEISISLVVKSSKVIIGLKSIHQKIFEKKITEIFLIGAGGVGGELIKQIHNTEKNKKTKKNIKLYCIANSRKMIIKENGIKLKNWNENLNKSKTKFKLKVIFKMLKQQYFNNPILIDCTSNNQIPKQYLKIIKNGFHIITPNKLYNTFNIKKYKKIRKLTKQKKKKFIYETNVGAGLPIIKTLRNLINIGDKIKKIKGILSGSLSYIFGRLDNKILFSETIKEAINLGFTEPNPRDDLLGLDVARKLLILAREIGYKIELKDIKIKPILPKEFQIIDKKDEFIKKIPQLNSYFLKKITKTLKKNKVLRFIGVIKSTGKIYIKLKKINKYNPLYEVKEGENALAFYSNYYSPIPLVIRGYGAGNNVTAAGIFTDLLKLS